MFKGDTPNIVIELAADTQDLTAADNVYVTFAKLSEGAYETLVQYDDDSANVTIAEHSVTVALSQSTTLDFPDTVYAQVNFIKGTSRGSSKIVMLTFESPLVAEELPPSA